METIEACGLMVLAALEYPHRVKQVYKFKKTLAFLALDTAIHGYENIEIIGSRLYAYSAKNNCHYQLNDEGVAIFIDTYDIEQKTGLNFLLGDKRY